MKYKEFEKIANNADYGLVKDSTEYHIEHKNVNNSISISKESTNLIFIENELCRPQDLKVIKAAIELAETPLKEREEEKKYYLRHRFLEDGSRSYLNNDYRFQELYLNGNDQFEEIQTQFTQEEIESMKAKYNTNLKDFEIIEVEE